MKAIRKLLPLFSLLLIAASAFAAETGATVVLKAARLIDGKSANALTGAVVVVSEGKITEMGRSSEIKVPAGAEVIDLGDATLLPGLIDTHTHILLQGDVTTADYDEQLFKESMPYRALRASRSVRLALDHGFTTLRDVETEGAMYTDVDVKKAIENGVIPGPRLVVSGRAMSVTGGYGPSGYAPEISFPHGVELVDGIENARKAVREQLAHGADWIKVYADRSYFIQDDGTLSSIPTFTADEMKAIVDEAHRLRHRVAAHAMARPGLQNALAAGVDSIEHGIALDDESVRQMVARGTYLVPTLTVTEYVAPGRAAEGRGIWGKVPEFHRASFRKALRSGVKIAFGTDAGGFPWELNEAREFTYMTRFGMTPMQAIQSATRVAAELLGMSDAIGTLEKGKVADIVAVPGNPLEDIGAMENVSFVMKNGSVWKSPVNGGNR